MNYLSIFFRTPSWFQAIFVFLGLSVVTYYFHRRRFFLLGNKLPGPKPLPFIGNILKFVTEKKYRSGALLLANHLANKYGLARLWIGHQLLVFICTPDDAMIYYSSPKMLDRSDFFILFKPIFGNGLQAINGSQWKEYRYMLDPVYKYKFLIKAWSTFQKKTDQLIYLLGKEANKTFSINRAILHCAADIACETFTGYEWDVQGLEEKSIFEQFEKIPIYVSKKAFTWHNLDWIFKWTRTGKKYFEKLDGFNAAIEDHINIYKTRFTEEIDSFNEDTEEINPEVKLFFLRHYFKDKTNQELRNYLLSTVIAAIDTTNTAVTLALMMLAIHQDVQQKLYEEISSAAEKNFDDKELRKLDYLNRVIQETLRLLPPIPVSPRKAGDDIWFGKHLVPKGASVHINIYAIHHDPNQYENPDNFDPDHFLPEKVAKRHPYSYIPFGMGKRNCSGYNFALMALRIFIAKIVYNYKIECDLKLEDVFSRLRLYISLKMKNLHYPVRIIKR